MKKQNAGQPIQLARREQKGVYNKTFYEKNKEKRRVCNKKYYKKLKMKMKNEGQPIQFSIKEQRRVYNKTYCEKNKEKGSADNKQYHEEFKMKKQNLGKRIQLRRRENCKCLGLVKMEVFHEDAVSEHTVGNMEHICGKCCALMFKDDQHKNINKNQKMCLKALTHRMQCEFAMISLQICITLGWHTACEFVVKITWPWPTQGKPSACMWGNSSHTVFMHQSLCLCQNRVCTKNHLCRQFTQLLNIWVYNNNGRSINRPCMTVSHSMGQARYDVQR